MHVADQETVGRNHWLPEDPTGHGTPRVPLARPRRWKGLHRAPSRRRRRVGVLADIAIAAGRRLRIAATSAVGAAIR
jgi:hypothetical protein